MITLGSVLAFLGIVGVSLGFIQISGKNHGQYEPEHKGDNASH